MSFIEHEYGHKKPKCFSNNEASFIEHQQELENVSDLELSVPNLECFHPISIVLSLNFDVSNG